MFLCGLFFMWLLLSFCRIYVFVFFFSFCACVFSLWCPLELTRGYHISVVSLFLCPLIWPSPLIHQLPLVLLLLLSGLCPNPGPSLFPCPVCTLPYDPRQHSFLCSSCGAWVHKVCSGLARVGHYRPDWRCPPCTSPSTATSTPSPLLTSNSSDSTHDSPSSNDPHQPLPSHTTGSILQFNCNGIQNSHQEISSLLHSQCILVAAIQESKLSDTSLLRDFPNFTPLRRDRPGPSGEGGLLTLVHESISFTPLDTDHLFPNDTIIEHYAITAIINGVPIKIFNIYIPPTSSCPSDYSPDLQHLFQTQGDSIILGDFNAHHPAWYSQTSDWRAASRGDLIYTALCDSDLTLLNTDSPTRLPTNGNPSSPDLTIATPHIAIDSEWRTITTLNSDHLPIIVQLGSSFSMEFPEPAHRTFINFKKADWEAFSRETEDAFATLQVPSSCSTGEKVFRQILLSASLKHIPRGHIRNFIPNLSNNAKSLIQQRDTIRSNSPNNPVLSTLNEQITQEIRHTNRQTWIHTVESCSHKYNATKFFSLLRSLSGKKTTTPINQPITFGSKTLSKNREIAISFNKQFTTIVSHSSDPDTRRVRRSLLRSCPLDAAASPFSPHHVSRAIRLGGNSRAAGPDGLTILHLKHLGPLAIAYLTHLFNLSYNHSNIPAIWKSATIIPLLKPGKPAGLGTSYRPISLLCPAAKVLERLLLPELNSLPLSATQHGFRSSHSTTTALLPLIHQVVHGFNQPRPPLHTVAVSIDLSKAFDTVNHNKLITSLQHSSLHNNTVRWLAAYLRGRSASCRYNNINSPHRHVHAGVLQGSCISPTLFNFFVSTYPHSDHLTTSYADDFTDASSSTDFELSASALTEHASRVTNWAEDHGLSISAPKSTVTLFTSDKRQSHAHPQVTLQNTILPLNRHPRLLGVTLDPHLTFSQHISSLITRAAPRINILKALAGTNWGQQAETIALTYKSLIRSLFMYAAPIWFPNTSPTNINRLQTLQNTALRIATGCVKMTPIGHLHAETKLLPVSDHLSLLSSQFLARALQPFHPSHSLVTTPPGPRNMKHTLQSRFFPRVSPYTVNGVIPPEQYRETIAAIHSEAVHRSIAELPNNAVLGEGAPPVAVEETSLPRPHRSALSQLRSGCCSSLSSFLALLERGRSNLCPSCGTAPKTTNHLFSCPIHPTNLVVRDLWDRPRLVANFLASLPFFNLPPIPPPPPEPPPEPPPMAESLA